jgi:hypothetical protein
MSLNFSPYLLRFSEHISPHTICGAKFDIDLPSIIIIFDEEIFRLNMFCSF